MKESYRFYFFVLYYNYTDHSIINNIFLRTKYAFSGIIQKWTKFLLYCMRNLNKKSLNRDLHLIYVLCMLYILASLP